MYRSNESLYILEAQLKKVELMLSKDPDNMDLIETRDDLKDRIRFAWEDDEAANDPDSID